MTDLITRAEQARTREEAVAVFEEYILHGLVAPGSNFEHHAHEARRSTDDTRAFEHLLLAAMAVIPEGWIIVNLGQNDDKTWFVELRQGYRTSYTAVAVVLKGHLHCCAALAAILKAGGEG